jgi:hypothetical protein
MSVILCTRRRLQKSRLKRPIIKSRRQELEKTVTCSRRSTQAHKGKQTENDGLHPERRQTP